MVIFKPNSHLGAGICKTFRASRRTRDLASFRRNAWTDVSLCPQLQWIICRLEQVQILSSRLRVCPFGTLDRFSVSSGRVLLSLEKQVPSCHRFLQLRLLLRCSHPFFFGGALMKLLCTHVLPKRLCDVGTSGIVVLVISPARKCNSVQEPSEGGCSSPVSSDHNVCACMFLHRECILKLSWFVQPDSSILSRRKSSFHTEHCSGHSRWIAPPSLFL